MAPAIRPMDRGDAPRVAALYERVARSGGQAPPHLAVYLERTLFDPPWFDPDVPPLVFEAADEGIAGFIGSHVRRLRLDGAPIRMGCSGPLVVDPAARNRAIGAFLLRRYLDGPQDVSVTDGATSEARRLWEGLGGETVHLRGIGWLRFFRPLRFLADQLLDRAGAAGLSGVTRPLWSLLDGILRNAPVPTLRSMLRTTAPPVNDEPLTPEALLGALPEVASAARLRLVPDYDEGFLTWLFAEMTRVTGRGPLVRRLVRDRAGRILGWWVAYLPPGGLGQAVQVAGAGRDVEPVVDSLLHRAERDGVAALHGRLEPRLVEPLADRGCLLRMTSRVLIHARDPLIVAAVLHGRDLLTRMEGEWWLGYPSERFA